MKQANAEVVRDYGPFPGIERVHGLTYDGRRIWFATDHKLVALDPESGALLDSIDTAADAGTAFDGKHLFQMAGAAIHKIDPNTGQVLATIPAPAGEGCNSGLAWAEGMLWVGQYDERKIHQVDPETGAVIRTIESNRFVTGVTWAGDELWHATWDGDDNELRRLDPQTGEVLESLSLPHGMGVSGLEFDGTDQFVCGRGASGEISVVRRPDRGGATESDDA